MKWFLLLIPVVVCSAFGLGAEKAEKVWYGIHVREFNDGETSSLYVMGQLEPSAVESLKSGQLKDGFVEATNVCTVDEETGEYEMNGEAEDSKEESNTVLYRVAMIDKLVVLKADPRTIFKKRPVAETPK